jgi:hypothetical protein
MISRSMHSTYVSSASIFRERCIVTTQCIYVFCLYLTTNTSLYLKTTESLFLKKECLLSGTNCITIQKNIIKQGALRYTFAIILLHSAPKLLPYVCSTFAKRMSGYRLRLHRH